MYQYIVAPNFYWLLCNCYFQELTETIPVNFVLTKPMARNATHMWMLCSLIICSLQISLGDICFAQGAKLHHLSKLRCNSFKYLCNLSVIGLQKLVSQFCTSLWILIHSIIYLAWYAPPCVIPCIVLDEWVQILERFQHKDLLLLRSILQGV